MDFVRDWDRERRHIAVNCWHANDNESAAMWSQYLPSNEGVAVRTDIRRYGECFNTTDYLVRGAMVQYVDYNHYKCNTSVSIAATIKRQSFEHEREFRGIISDAGMLRGTFDKRAGFYVSVDVDCLIRDVWLAPTTPEWLEELVSSILKRYGLKKCCLASPSRKSNNQSHTNG